MDDKNLFDRQNGQGIRGRISRGQRSTVVLDEPMITEEYSDYKYSEPVDNTIETDNVNELGSKEDSGSSRLIKDPAIEFESQLAKTLTVDPNKRTLSNITKVNTKIDESKGKVGTYDEMFSFLNGISDTRISSKQGDLVRNNIDLQSKIDYLTNTVSKAQEAKAYEQQLSELEGNPEEFNKVHNMYETAMRQYYTMKPKADSYLKEFHEADKDINGFSDISKIKGSAEMLNYLQNRGAENNAQIVEKVEDINEEQGTKRYINSIYEITPEYKEKAASTKFAFTDPSTWKYTVPQTLGSSFGLMEATAVATVSSLAGNYLLKQLPKLGMTGGASLLSTLAVTVGASAANVWANIKARQEESNAEIYGSYKEKIYKLAEEGKFDIDAVIQEGAKKMEELVGIDPTTITPDQVLDGIVMYNLNIEQPGFNQVRDDSRKDINKLYDQNMALAVSDVAQSLLIIPGAGKLFTKAITLNGKVKLGDELGSFANKALDNTTRSIATNMSKLKTVPVVGKALGSVTQTGLKRVVTKGITPMAKLGISSVGEMNEEGVQYIQGRNYLMDKYKDQPSNILKGLATNFDATIDAFSGLLGVSSDPALNNDVDLAQNMKLGAVISIIMGGGSQVLYPGDDNIVKSYIDDVAGSKIAKKLTAEHIKAKEDVETIKRYATAGIDNQSKQDGYLNQLEEMKNTLPPGLDAEDIDVEIKRAKKMFSYLDSPTMNSFASRIGVQKGTDRYNNFLALAIKADENAITARKNYTSERSKYDNLWAAPEVQDFFETNNIPTEQRSSYLDYIKLNTEKRALDNTIQEIADLDNNLEEMSNRYGFNRNRDRIYNYMSDLAETSSKLGTRIEQISSDMQENYGEAPVLDRIDDLEYAATTSLPTVFLNATRYSEADKLSRAFKGLDSGKYDAVVERALDDYDNVQQINEEANNSVAAPEQEVVVEEVPDEMILPTPIAIPTEVVPEVVENPSVEEVTAISSVDEITPTQTTTEEEKVPEKGLEQATEGVQKLESTSENEYDKSTEEEAKRELGFDPNASEEDYSNIFSNMSVGDEVMPEQTTDTTEKPVEQGAEVDTVESTTVEETAPIEATEVTTQQTLPLADRVEALPTEPIKPITGNSVDALEFKLNTEDDLATDETTLVGTDIVKDQSEKEYSMTNGTVFFIGKAMFEGDQDAAAFDEYLSTPGSLIDDDIEFVVGKPGAKYNENFDPNNEVTWGEAAIYVKVKAKNGKTYSGALKTYSGARSLYERLGKPEDVEDIRSLMRYRTAIIESYLAAGEGAVIKPRTVRKTNGLFNVNRDSEGKAIRRPAKDVKGLGIPEDITKLEESGIKIGVGRGARNNFYIVDKGGYMMPGVGGSGKIYIYPRKEDTPSGDWAPPIKLNELRFSDKPDLAELLYNTFVQGRNDPDNYYTKLTPDGVELDPVVARLGNRDVVEMLVNQGEHTLVKEAEDIEKFPFLLDKQLYFDYNHQVYFVGKNRWTRDYLLTPQGKKEFIDHVIKHSHVNTDEATLYNKLNKNLYNIFSYYPGISKIKLSESLTFDRDDFDIPERKTVLLPPIEKTKTLTQMEWMFKHGWLLSDLKDQIFKSPFMYVKGIDVKATEVKQQEAVKEITDSANPINGEGNAFLEDPMLREWFGLDLALPEPLVSKEASAENTEKSRVWLIDKLGLTEDQVTVADGFIRTAANGAVVMGTTYKDGIVLSNASVPGTGYHEAFHRVSTLLLSKSQQNKLYSEYRKANPEYAKRSDIDVEEALAEDFRSYMLKREKPIYQILKWFNPISTFIRKMFKPDAISTIYSMLSNGNFSKYKMSNERYAEFESAYPKGLDLITIGDGVNSYSSTNFPDYHSYYNVIIPSLTAMLLMVNRTRMLSDINKIQTSKLREYLQGRKLASRGPKQASAIGEILDHFDTVFMPDVMNELERLSIRAVDRDRDEDMENIDSSGIQAIQNYDKASYEVSKKDNALASAKMFIGTIVKTSFVYQDINGIKVRSSIPELDPITGMLSFIDFDTSWNLVMNNLYNVETYNDLISKTESLSKESAFFYELNKSLKRVTDVSLQTQLLQTIKSNKHNMVTIKYGTKKAADGKSLQVYWTVDDSAADKVAMTYPTTWSQVFYNSDLVVNTEEGSTVNVKSIDSIKNEFVDIVNDITNKQTVLTDGKVDTVIASIVKLLNRVGIAIDKDTFESAITDPKIASPTDTRTTAMMRVLTDTRNGSLSYIFTDNLPSLASGPKEHKTGKGSNVRTLSNVYQGLGKNSIVGILAKHYAKLNPSPEELMVLGADGNLLYPISQNCYMSDQVRWLNMKKDALDQLRQVTYCSSSLIKGALEDNHDIKLNTFVNFKNEDGGDRGRDYMQISPVEDYLAKMTLTANDHIVLPTMADKKMYFTISGTKLFNNPLQIVQGDNGPSIYFSDETIAHFVAIGADEFNTIKQYYANKEKVESDKDLKVKNYHTGKLGGRFRHFTHMYKLVNGNPELVSLNDILSKAEADGTIDIKLSEMEKALFSPTSNPSYVKGSVNSMLKLLMATELDTSEKLGIIYKKDGVLHNNSTIQGRDKEVGTNGLDHARLSALIDYYKNKPDMSDYAEHYAVMTMIGNYAANSAISIIEVEKVFSGDPAFYKTPDDKIKRLSEVLSTGDNLRLDWPSGHRLENRQKFTATELNDNEIVSAQFDELKELFTRSYARKFIKEFYGLPENKLDAAVNAEGSKQTYTDAWVEAEKTAAAAVSAYGFNTKRKKGNINQADAAVYVSPAMYKDMMEMLGEWSPEIARAYDIMESDQDWLSNPTLYHESLEALIKPLKMMYYGQHLIPELGIQVPIFDKMAMFPMFKVMATGDNRVLYDRMNALGDYAGSTKIDMVAFGSAIKVGSRNPGDFYTDPNNGTISDLTKMAVFNQDFKYLRRQLITDPHHSERQMLGTQAAKAALSNLVFDRMYGEGKEGEQLTGEQIRDIAFECMKELSNDGVSRVLEEIGNENGELDINKLSEFLIRNAKSKGMGSEILDGLQVIDGKFKVPLSALSDSKWVESTMVGIINKEAVDINLPGGAFIQMSSFGFKSINTVSDSAYNGGKRLNLHNPDGSMDAMVSINLFSHIIPGYERKSFVQAKQWLIDNGIIGTTGVSPVAMGYRIPTQGLSSISALRIVDIFPSNIGDTVMLPDEFTALTGSDFDVDKLYVARYNYETYEDTDGTLDKDGLLRTIKKARKVPFDDTKSFAENSREALENRLLDMYIKVLTDNSNVDETRLPLDNTTDIVKDVILPVVDGPANNKSEYAFKYVSPTFQLNKKYEYSGGKNGIGPFALNNVHHVLTQLLKLNYKANKVLESFGFGSLSEIDDREVRDYTRSQYGEILSDKDGNPIHDTDRGGRILDWLSAMINAHVDVAKDPYIIRLNVVQWTYDMADFLLRSGFGKDTFFFLPQPILKDMAAEVQKLTGKYGVDAKKSKSKLEKEAVQKVLDNYAEKGLELAKSEEDENLINRLHIIEEFGDSKDLNSVLNRGFLIEQLQTARGNNKDVEYYINQLKVYRTFAALTPFAQELSELVHLSQIDTKKFGNNFNLQRRFMYRLKKYILNNKVFDRYDLTRFFRDSFLDTKIRNSVMFNDKLFKGLMITSTDKFTSQIEAVLQSIDKRDTKDDTVIKIISNEIEASVKASFFEGYASENDIDIKGMYYGKDSMAARLSRLKTDILMEKYPDLLSTGKVIKNELLNYLSAEFKQLNEEFDSPNIITVPRTKSNDKYLEKRLTKYWEELLNSPHPEIAKFAKDLVVYSFMSSGDNYNKNSFFNLVPNYYRKEIGYTSAIDNSIDMLNQGTTPNDLDSIFTNTWYNDNLVDDLNPYGKDRALGSASDIRGKKYNVLVTKPQARPIGVNAEGQPIYRPYLKMNLDKTNNPETTVLYKYIGFYIDQTEDRQVPIYAAVNKKGLYLNGKVVREYNDNAKSILPFNNIPYSVTENSNLFETETFSDKNGEARKRYKNISIIGKEEAKYWYNAFKNMETITDYNIEENVDAVSYDDIMDDNFKESDMITKRQNAELKPKTNDVLGVINLSGASPNMAVDPQQTVTSTTSGSTFTFKNGKSINTPFPLNAQQETALNELAEFLQSPEVTNNEVTLTGYAGTGKTTIMGIFDEYIRNTQPSEPKYAAVTYRANAVTKMNNPNAKTFTLNSLFGISAEVDISSPVLDMREIVNNKAFAEKVEPFDLVIIDEASMVSPAFYEYINEAKNRLGIRVIYVGDPAQLSPVDGKSDISPVFKATNSKLLSLTKVERTGDNPILAEATGLREGKDLTYTTKVNDRGEGVTYTNSEQEASDFIKESFNSEEFKTNKLYFRVLSAVNDMLSNANHMARKAIFGDNPKQLEVGDVLTGYDNVRKGSNPEPIIINSGDYVVKASTPIKIEVPLSTRGDHTKTRKVTLDGFKVTIADISSGKEVDVNIASTDTPFAIANDIANELQMLHANKNAAYRNRDANKGRAIDNFIRTINSKYISMKNYEQNGKLKVKKALDYGYAITVHKSQGGTYNKVLIYSDTIDRFKDEKTRQQLKYVAVSRAKENVMILTNEQLGTEEVQNVKPTTINIYYKTRENADLSNFASRPFTIPDINSIGLSDEDIDVETERPLKEIRDTHFETVEGAFQAAKLAYALDLNAIDADDFESVKSALINASGSVARSLGRSTSIDEVISTTGENFFDRWSEVSTYFMKFLIKESFKQNPDATNRLLSTGNSILTHTQDNGKWRTEFPRILMEVRDELRNETAKPEDTAAKQWSSKEGWSEAYYKSKVLPKLDNAWQVEFELAPDQNVKHDFKGTMLFDYGNNKNSNVTASSTIEAIGNGERTATTRYESDGHMDYWNRVNIGDVIEYTRPGYFPVKVVVTKPFTKLQGTKPEDAFTQLKKEEQGVETSHIATTHSVPTTKIISGGQTGVDRIGLEIGKILGIQTGGTTTPGFYTEKGRDESLKEFGVEEVDAEIQSGKTGKEFYLPRTEQNVVNSDGTVYFATNEDSAGKIATERFANKHNKPFLLNPTADKLNKWLNDNNIKTLNVAGNRGSRLTDKQQTNIGNIIKSAFSLPIQQELFTESTYDNIFNSMRVGDTEVEGTSIQNLVNTNDEGIKQMYISTRKAELEQLIQDRTDIDVEAVGKEFNATIEEHKSSSSDVLNNALIKLLCKF